jgi:hypothetical protein
MAANNLQQDALRANDLTSIKASLLRMPPAERQNELDECLIFAMPQCSLELIKTLLDLGAKLKRASFHKAFERGDTAVFKLLIEAGWDMNSTEFQLTALQ